MANRRIDEPTGIETVGHEWDGIEELNNPLPRWWVLTLWATVIWALGYVVVYPAIPLLNRGTQGIWGWSSRGQLEGEIKAANKAREGTLAAIAATPLEQLSGNKDLLDKAVAGGRAAFQVNCIQCHGSGAAGSLGYPNLKDDDWLWGGNIREIETTIRHGIRSPGVAETRTSLMPSFGKDGVLNPGQIDDVTGYVLSLSGKAPAAAANANGAALFTANCAVCHGGDAKGLRQFGAPNLADAVWLYGGKPGEVSASIGKAHAGVMPAWSGKLDAVTIKMLAAYVHSLGGGEDFTQAPTTPAAEGGNAQP
jgi:cytochrome c oxidase cbb3-type subunit 3